MGSCDYEAVSALVDGELGEQECEGVIRHLNDCRECCRLFERFHATRNLVRGDGGPNVPVDFCERVSAAIANEAPPAADNVSAIGQAGKRTASKPRPVWGWAAAAGLAGVTLAAGLLALQSPAPDAPGSSPNLAQSSQPASENRSQSSSDADNVAAIKRYLPEHSSFVPSGSGAEFQRTRLDSDKR
jgi:negative regulator of sigma E activity